MRLVARNGPLSGTAVPLANGVTIPGPMPGRVAKPSCRVVSENGRFVLHALDRHPGVFVNGLPSRRRVLAARDELRIGDSLFVVHEDPPPPSSSSSVAACPVTLEPGAARASTVAMTFEEALLHDDGLPQTREARDLATLLRVGAALSSVMGLAAFDSALAALLLDVVPIERMVLLDSNLHDGAVRSAWRTTSASPDALSVDPALVTRVATERVALVADGADRGVVVVPMMAFGRVTGVIWAETARGGRLGERDVRLLLVVLALAAVSREQARETARLQEANERLQAEINLEHNMVGGSRAMRLLFDRIARVARSDSTILLRGESGTGKELVARAVHRNSARANRPFIAINCAALTESLLESELFGHEKGAFTGAVGLKHGKIELAGGGTLFLDEVAELPLPLQAKLLRALQEREFERVGGTRPIKVDFRLIAATNQDLVAAVKAGTFRQDLFYRLNVITLSLPALRERREDVTALTEYFLRKHAPRCGRRVHGVDEGALERLVQHDWPGNVRELENVIEQALVLGAGDCISAADLPAGLGVSEPAAPSSMNYHEGLDQARRDLIVRAFERADHSHAGAARLLGVHPNYLHRLLRNLDLRQATGGRVPR